MTFTLGGSAIGTATADADGNASITFTVPSGATASASFTASGMGANGTLLELSTVLGVSLAAGATTTVGSASDPLPVTGSDATGDLARLGVVLIAGGALAVLVVKHRRASALAA